MRLRICAVGRMKSGPETELLDRYVERARKAGRALGITRIEIREIPESRAASADRRRAEEADALVAAVPAGALVIALDERGRDNDSQALAGLIEARLADATPEIAFLVGGPDGHGDGIASRAAMVIRFGKATWPHQLVRIMLAEQLYRAVTILSGHPYHRE